MAQNFWLAAFAFLVCFVLTIVISLATKRTKTNEELKGLVYSLTPRIVDHEQNFFLRPAVLGTILLIVRYFKLYLLVMKGRYLCWIFAGR
jgi:SSS family solute:Na+ symporter